MNPMFNQYKQKKKRKVNPDAPPRPTLLGHDLTIRNMQNQIDRLDQQIADLTDQIDKLKLFLNKNLRLTKQQINARSQKSNWKK